VGRYGLIGKTLGHSFSPEVHRCFADYDYRLIELPEEQVGTFLKMRAFDGLNVTIPYKRTVMPFLDAISEEAQRIGSVNTIVNRGGKLIGYNTDYYGFCRLAESVHIDFSGKKVLVLGSGGASLTAMTAASDLGASAVYTVSRAGTGENGVISYEMAYRDHIDAAIIVNATPVGMYPHAGASPIDLARFLDCEAVLDMICNPLKTALLLQAERLHIPCANGLMMLVAQGKRASELFTGNTVDAALETAAVRSITDSRKNLVLIGMPGTGKSTVGKIVAKELGMEFIDLDDMIVKRTGRTPAAIIEADGEAAFRSEETAAAQAVGAGFHRVIAAGGGAVTRVATVDALMQNALVILLERPLDSLATAGRPLSKGGAALEELWRVREPLYRCCAKVSVQNNKTAEEAADAVCRIFSEELP